jgi:transcriptional regulator with PAS, ATPase and Fis domain
VEATLPQLESFLSGWLKLVGEEIPCCRAALVLYGPDRRLLLTPQAPDYSPGLEEEASALVEQAIAEGRPLLLSGRERSSHFCLPLTPPERPPAALCLSRDDGMTSFSAEEMETLSLLGQSLDPVLDRYLGRTIPPPNSETKTASDPIIGTSRAARDVRSLIDKVKDTEAPVFILGESGTGKELIARAIHERGLRRSRPFIAVNCGAIPDPLLESELFGHARGAFTGALRDKAGLIEEASGGTFFLDEVGDLSLPLQAKLLRLLQEKEIRRVGETRTRRLDVRFVSATNKDIEKEMERGNFRLDLYYRLRIITIEVPPLRERKEDLLLFINHFVDKYSLEMKRRRPYLSPQALELLLEYSWPGNIRELQNEIQRCLILAEGGNLISEDHLSARINPHPTEGVSVSCDFFEARNAFEKRFLNQMLERFAWNKTRTAEAVGLSRQGLFKLLKKYNLGRKTAT